MEEPVTKTRKFPFKFRSIQTKLTLAIIFILIPIVTLTSLLSFRNAQTLLRDRIFELLESVITARQDRLNDLVTRDVQLAKQISSSSELQAAIQSVNTQTNKTNEKALQALLKKQLSLYSDFEAMVIINPEGTPSAAVHRTNRGETPVFPPLDSTQENTFKIHEDEGTFFVSGPIELENESLGTLLLQIKKEKIQNILKDYSGLGRTGEIILAKRDGEDVVYLNTLRNLQNPGQQYRLRIKDNPRLPTVLAVQQLSEPAITNDYRGVEVIAAYRHFPLAGWGLIAKIDAQEAFAPIQTLKTELLQVSVLTLLLFILVAFIVSRSIIKPLQKLHIGAEKIGKGEWDYKLDIKSGDEVQQLAIQFTHMAQELKSLYEGLETKVKERTSELQEAKDEIDREKTKAETILTSIGDGVVVTDRNGQIIFFNRAAEEFTGYTKEESLGKDFYEVVGILREENKPLAKEETPTMAALKEEKITRTDKLFYTRKSGEMYPIALVATPLIIGGAVHGAIVTFKDITREKEIDRMKTEFISVASHQLRTPLSAIKWFTEMLIAGDAGKPTAEQKEFLEQVYGSNERMIELVNALLNVSRIEQGRIAIEPEPTDLIELVNQVLTELTPKIEEKKLKVVFSKHEKLPKIFIDPKLIRQVYANLLSNAMKYTPEKGEITILISRKGDEIISQISDKGYGIPKNQQDRIFTKFFRADNIRGISTEGTGLGLHIAKSVVESSGGKIWFESEEGKGTTFWFTLPASGSPAKSGERTLEETKL
ncbi:PAS domain-containing protein [Patescibacteria group bacterium]|nr:PAS domain-containing protein [Patescibacteria group bacterium]